MFSLLDSDSHRDAKVLFEILRTVNLRVDVRIPNLHDPDAQEIPLPDDEAFTSALGDGEIEAEPLQTVDLAVDYVPVIVPGEDKPVWVPSLFGMTTIDLQAIAEPMGHEVPELRLPDDIRRRMEYEGIVEIAAEAREDGLFMAVNGHRLPHVAWSETTLANLSDVLARLFPEGVEEGDDVDWVDVVRSSAPMYNDYSIAVLLRFPVEEAPSSSP
jgi:hypothetical protein